MISTFFFTYGLGDDNGQDYVGGWTEVEAATQAEAIMMYKKFHVGRNGLMPCCGVAYTINEMTREFKYIPGKSMLTEGNGGKFCHDRIRKVDGEIVREVIA